MTKWLTRKDSSNYKTKMDNMGKIARKIKWGKITL